MSTEPLHLAPVPIRLRGCGKHFGGQRVLDPLDLDIGAGETLVLLGPSGCGKTTTLRIVAGLEAPDAGGTVRFGDEDVTAHPIERRRVGMVFQNYALFPNLGVRGNVEYGLRIQRRRNRLTDAQIRARADALLEMMHLTPYAERAIGQLSGGQRQRVALARALAPEPRVLLLDEPLTALDAKLRESVRAEMDRLLRGLGITTVYVTHDQEEAMALADRIVVMDAGRIAQIGTPREVYFQPTNRHVADFIGIMNRLDGVWQGGVFVCAGGRVRCRRTRARILRCSSGPKTPCWPIRSGPRSRAWSNPPCSSVSAPACAWRVCRARRCSSMCPAASSSCRATRSASRLPPTAF